MMNALLGLFCVTLIGFIAHRVGLCLVRAVKQALDKQPGLMLAILMSGLWVGVYSLVALHNGWTTPFARYSFHPLFVIGGFIFGVGASVNQGCSVSTMHQFARGNLSMLFTMLGWFAGWCVWISLTVAGVFNLDYQLQASLDPSLLTGLVGVSVVVTLIIVAFMPSQRGRWFGISLIGLLVGVLFFIEPTWAPSRLVQDTGAAFLNDRPLPSLYRNLLVLMMLVGMWISVLVLGDIRLRLPTTHKIIRHSIAGLLMGAGGAMALGGNDSQILLGLPVLSIGAIVAVLAMFAGIATEQLLYHRGKLFYQKL